MLHPLSQDALDAAGGLSGELMLVFAFVVWVFFLMILLASPRNRLNQWGFLSGMILSIGVLKEYLFYSLGPDLIAGGIWSAQFSAGLYSVLSAIFYYCSMPSMLILALYFIRLDQLRPLLFRHLIPLIYLPALVFFLVVPCTQTRQYQFVPVYCLAVGLYNYAYGIVFTILLGRMLYEERFSAAFRQRRMAAVCILIPLWYWLLSGFPWHVFGFTFLLKAWQGNLLVVSAILVYYLYHAFRDGIWGVRFRPERYDWTSGETVLQKNAAYVSHALKGDLAKIQWCVSLLRQRGADDHELEIIEHSAGHLLQFAERTRIYAQNITLACEPCDMSALLREAAEDTALPAEKPVSVLVSHCDSVPLLCDRTLILEVLRNLISNSVDAVERGGTVQLSYHVHKRCAELCVRDDGRGLSAEEQRQLFEPYYTTKDNRRNMGLGLYYCWNVAAAHKGHIRVESAPGAGSAFTLVLPMTRCRQRGAKRDETHFHTSG